MVEKLQSTSHTINDPKSSNRCRIMDMGNGLQKAFRQTPPENIGLTWLWSILHFLLSIWFIIVTIAQMLESFLISNRYPESYPTLNIQKVKYLAVAIDSEEAKKTKNVLRLLEWLRTIGVKNVCFYDSEGVLKKSKDTIKESLSCDCLEDDVVRDSLSHQHIQVDFASFNDGKESVAKAANYIFRKYYLDCSQAKPNLAERNMAEALKAIGCGAPDPDLLLVYGPTRAHMGFPAWRIRYTEIVHMGSLSSMKFGLLIQAIQKFTMVRQNYGT